MLLGILLGMMLVAAGVAIALRRFETHLEAVTKAVEKELASERAKRQELELRVARKPTSRNEAITVQSPRGRVLRVAAKRPACG